MARVVQFHRLKTIPQVTINQLKEPKLKDQNLRLFEEEVKPKEQPKTVETKSKTRISKFLEDLFK